MDPKACLIRLDQALSDCDWSEAVSALNDYYKWRVRGGPMPRFIPNDNIRGLILGDDIADRCASILAVRLEHVSSSLVT